MLYKLHYIIVNQWHIFSLELPPLGSIAFAFLLSFPSCFEISFCFIYKGWWRVRNIKLSWIGELMYDIFIIDITKYKCYFYSIFFSVITCLLTMTATYMCIFLIRNHLDIEHFTKPTWNLGKDQKSQSSRWAKGLRTKISNSKFFSFHLEIQCI